MTAELHVLTNGYAHDRVASTVTLVREGDAIIVVDPGMVAARSAILDPLAALGIHPDEVTDVVFSHHHPDHTVNAALFLHARIHDFMATYEADLWSDRDPEGPPLAPSVQLLSTPGHTDEDLSTIVQTADGLVVLTHLWWSVEGPADDPFARDRDLLRASREAVLALDPALIVPGHGAAFVPGPGLARLSPSGHALSGWFEPPTYLTPLGIAIDLRTTRDDDVRRAEPGRAAALQDPRADPGVRVAARRHLSAGSLVVAGDQRSGRHACAVALLLLPQLGRHPRRPVHRRLPNPGRAHRRCRRGPAGEGIPP